MLDLNKSLEFFNPSVVDKTVTIIGCGAVGSHVCDLLARLGINSFELWDKDTVAPHNIANQNFVYDDIGRSKVDVVADRIQAISPGTKVVKHNKFFIAGQSNISGWAVLCVDNIDVRRDVAKSAMVQPWVQGLFDFRMGLTSGQFMVATPKNYNNYLAMCNFSNEDADALTPHSACGYELSVAYSIWSMLGVGVSLMVKKWSGEDVPAITMIDTGNLNILPC